MIPGYVDVRFCVYHTHGYNTRANLGVSYPHFFSSEVFGPCLLKLWIYSHYSAPRKERMDKIFKLFSEDDGEVVITKAAFTRWLSHEGAVLHQRKYLSFEVLEMTADLATEGMDAHHKAEHLGTVKTVRTFMFFATVYFLCDVLKPIGILFRQLQFTQLCFRQVRSSYEACRTTVQAMLDSCDELSCPSLMTLVQEVGNLSLSLSHNRSLSFSPPPSLSPFLSLSLLPLSLSIYF